MKKLILLPAFALLVILTALFAGAEGYKDVTEDEWYFDAVQLTAEAGLFSGTGSGMFSPADEISVAETVTVAARLNAAYNGKEIDAESGALNWYDSYISYAIEAGIIESDWFDDYGRDIKRWETARIFANTVPESSLVARNDVDEIPDVPETNIYFDDLLLLYNAGVMMGNDEFGTFQPTKSITRAETAAVVYRMVFPDRRLEKTLTDANYDDAYYLVHERSPRFSSGTTYNDSPWNYDNRNRVGVISNNANQVSDYYDDGTVELWRDLDDVSDGLIGWDFYGGIGLADDGIHFDFTDDNKNPVISLHTLNGNFYVNDTDTGRAADSGTYYISLRADLDNHTAELYINGSKTGGSYSINGGTVSRFYVMTEKETVATVNVTRCDIYKDYVVNDIFLVPEDSGLAAWNVTGKATVVRKDGQGYSDTKSAELAGGSTAEITFNKISGDVVFEVYMLFQSEEDEGYISLNSRDNSVARISVNADGVFKADGTKLRHHTNNIWQCLRIEADTVNGSVLYKVNGKKVGEYAFDSYADFVDGITVGATGGTVYFDDVQVFLNHEYDDYCPEPVPVTDDGYDVIMNVCSLWREGAHSGWGAVSGYPDVEPALGYYDEGIPEVADWEIKFMVENGIDVQHLCWYCPSSDIKAPIKRSSHNNALHDGYFNSKYSDMMKLTFMWENSNTNCYNLDQFKTYIWNYWMDYYFLDDRYYTIDNKLVFTVWNYSKFKTAFGGTNEGCLEAIEFMNNDAKAHGFDGVMIFFADGHNTSESPFKQMAAMGGSASYGYHWNQDGVYAENTIKRMQKNQDYGAIHIVPTVSVGFNNIGWSGERKPMATTEEHRKVVEYIKNNYLPAEDGWKAKTMIVSTWNEYGEGTYVMPSAGLHGFGYLDNIRQVISGVEEQPNNIYPTEQQKARLGHIYPDSKTSLAKHDYVDPMADNMPEKVVYSVTGADVKAGKNATGAASGTVFIGKSSGADPYLTIKTTQPSLEADKVKAIKIVMKSDVGCTSEIHFATDTSPELHSSMRMEYTTVKSDDFVEYIIPTEGVANWSGTITQLRFDVLTTSGNFEFAKCELLGYTDGQMPASLKVDGVEYKPCLDITEENGEYYSVAEPISGFFSLHNFYYEWSRFTNKLYILTKNNNEFEFTAGSDTAFVNGEKVKLDKAVELTDGLPVLPLTFIYDADGIEYSISGKSIEVYVAGMEAADIIASRVPYEYEFELEGDPEGFTASSATMFVYDGALQGQSIYRPNESSKYDPMYNLSGLSVDTTKYSKIVIAMKHELDTASSSEIKVYFRRDSDDVMNETRAGKATITGQSSGDEYVIYEMDMSANENWNGTVSSIRFDPINCAGSYAVDYIRFV